ncbi:TPA: hypothetical protein J6006_002768 [Escherichia coli]|uniref:Uncharacterized protein n=2 Tax=Escherichia coli TaxID=562 RepID=A0A6L6ZWZ4_ECOLX|nr:MULTISPECIES: hypothetical protein [Enterobacteriaceae]MED7149060.1 hypothetical protein [Escherichia coli O157]EEW3004810.1 hypothetical protein [Escherichia coli]EFH8012566.1 hypothetical protein [Escherichia coli]EFH9844592.1 hypothetical protein [Escherichia coli]EFJ2239747.1 hypothetical protein [Escherichia coli]
MSPIFYILRKKFDAIDEITGYLRERIYEGESLEDLKFDGRDDLTFLIRDVNRDIERLRDSYNPPEITEMIDFDDGTRTISVAIGGSYIRDVTSKTNEELLAEFKDDYLKNLDSYQAELDKRYRDLAGKGYLIEELLDF